MSVTTLQEKYSLELAHLYDAEQRFLKAQVEMEAHATDPTLKAGMQQHVQQSRGQIDNLEQVYRLLGQDPRTEECGIATSLIENAEGGLKEKGGEALRDCLIGTAASMVEYYEIASYRGLIGASQAMNLPEVVALLQENLRQEELTAQKLESGAPALMQKAMHSAPAV
jgi:ferritin-like metal-binding protein YciE